MPDLPEILETAEPSVPTDEPTIDPTDVPTTPEPPEPTDAPTQPATPPPAKTPRPTKEPPQTLAPTKTPRPTTAPTSAPTDVPASAPTDAPVQTPLSDPTNAHEFADFTQGYAFALTGTALRTKAHDRRTSYEILPIAAEELVLVTGRTAYVPARDEEIDEDEDIPDWFAVSVRDSSGMLVEGMVCGTDLFPLTEEETEGLLAAWAQEVLLPEHSSSVEDGIPCVSGVFAPPPPEEPEESAQPVPAEPVEPSDAPADTPEPTLEPITETVEPSETPLAEPPSIEAESPTAPAWTPTPVPESSASESPETEPVESAVTAEPTAAPSPDPVDQSLLHAQRLISEGENFLMMAPILAQQAVIKLADDHTLPEILGIEVRYNAATPPALPQIAMLAIRAQDSELNNATETVSGIRLVTGTGPDAKVRPCTYDVSQDAFVLAVYVNGLYQVTVTDVQGNVATATAVVSGLDGGATQDDTPPVIGAITMSPPAPEWADAAELSFAVTDLESGVGEVWLEDAGGLRIMGELQSGDTYAIQVFENATYTLYAQDRAGNRTDPAVPVTITHVKNPDTYPPTIGSFTFDPPPRDDGVNEVMVEVWATITDLPRPDAKPPERASGVAKVEIARVTGEDDTGNLTYEAFDVCPLRDMSGDTFTYAFFEDGWYAFVATDHMGNVSLSDFEIGYIGEVQPKRINPDWYLKPRDDDMDGLYTQTEFRLDLNPANRDTNDDGLWDGLSVRLGLSANDKNTAPEASVLTRSGSADMLEKLVKDGRLLAPIAEKNPQAYRGDVQRRWKQSSTTVAWMAADSNQMVCINSNAVFTARMSLGGKVEVSDALSLYALEMRSLGKGGERTLTTCGDGSLALLYDTDGYGGALRKDAYLIDTARMQAYRVPNTHGARDVAISSDGNFLAIWYDARLVRITLSTGDVFQCDDAKRCGNIEMISFLPDGRLVTRVTALGYSALTPAGTREIGEVKHLPRITQRQSIKAITVYDRDYVPMKIDLQLLLRDTGLFVGGENPKDKIQRNLTGEALAQRATMTLRAAR